MPIRTGVNYRTKETEMKCVACDSTNEWVFFEDDLPDQRDRDCVVDWLNGALLSSDETQCSCFQSDPFDDRAVPKLAKEKRYFMYQQIAKALGVTGKGKRAKLPGCVTRKIAHMYPDPTGAPTKEGYRQGP